jgi:HK97 family phage portal protein
MENLGLARRPAGLADMLTTAPKAVAGGELQSLASDDGWIIRALGGGKTDSGMPVSQWSAITFPAVYSCVSVIADNIAQLPCSVRKRRKDGQGSDPVLDHPLNVILNEQSNDDMSAFVTRQTGMHHTLLWGNGYGEIERTRGGDPVAVWPLYPDRTFPYKPPGQALVYRSTVNAKSVTLDPADVIHIPAMGFDGYLGYSPVSVARQAVGLGLAMERFGSKFFANDAKSGGFLQHPGKLGDKAKENIAESFQQQGGPENAFRVKVLEEGMKFISTTIAPDDAQFLASREFQIAEIARIFHVPLVLLQSMEKTSSWGSGIEQIMIGFVVWTLQPWIVKIEQEYNRKLLTAEERKAGLFIKLNLKALQRGDMKARGQYYRDMQAVAAMNANEIRGDEDMNPYPDGDKYFRMLNTEDVSAPPEEPDAAPDPAEDDPPTPPKPKTPANEEDN